MRIIASYNGDYALCRENQSYYLQYHGKTISQESSPSLINLCLFYAHKPSLLEVMYSLPDEQGVMHYFSLQELIWIYHRKPWVVLYLRKENVIITEKSFQLFKKQVKKDTIMRIDKNCYINMTVIDQLINHQVYIGEACFTITPYYFKSFIEAYINRKY